MKSQQKVALVTGASSGIGRATAIALAREGFIVYGGARRVEAMEGMPGVLPLPLDVTDEESASQVVQAILTAHGHIDVLVNNAGYGSYGAVEDVPLEEAQHQFDVNVFGLARMTQLVTTSMRERKSGRIINVGSMGGRMYAPFGAWYHATKYALEGFTDCLRLELAPFGIKVALIEPGMIRSEWAGIAADRLEMMSGHGAYRRHARRTARGMRDIYATPLPSSPEKIAQAAVHAATAWHPKPRYLVGTGSHAMVFLHDHLPTRCYDRLVGRLV